MQVQECRQPACVRPGGVVFTGDRGPGAVELFGPARPRECLERMHAETADVRIEGGHWCGAADVRDPGPRDDGAGDVADRGIRHAQQHEIHAIVPDRHGRGTNALLIAPPGSAAILGKLFMRRGGGVEYWLALRWAASWGSR